MVALDTEMLNPLVTSLTANSAILVPIGITIMGILVGIQLIPKILYKFL